MSKTSVVGQQEGDARDWRATTTYVEDIDCGPPRR
jgi:hypothetical protein